MRIEGERHIDFGMMLAMNLLGILSLKKIKHQKQGMQVVY